MIGVALAWFPRLLWADPVERAAVEINPFSSGEDRYLTGPTGVRAVCF